MKKSRSENRSAAEEILRLAQSNNLIDRFTLHNRKTENGGRSRAVQIEISLVHPNELFNEICDTCLSHRGRTDWSLAYTKYDRHLRALRRRPKRILAKQLRKAGVQFGGEIRSHFINRVNKIIPVGDGYILNQLNTHQC